MAMVLGAVFLPITSNLLCAIRYSIRLAVRKPVGESIRRTELGSIGGYKRCTIGAYIAQTIRQSATINESNNNQTGVFGSRDGVGEEENHDKMLNAMVS